MKRTRGFVVAVQCILMMGLTTITAFATETEVQQEIAQIADLTVDTGNTEADTIFNTYLETAVLMVDDPEYSTMFALYRGRAEEWYVEYAGGTSEEWNSFTDMEVFCWDALYLSQITCLESGMYDYYYGSIENFHAYALPVHYRMDEVQEAAYFEIMDWQYNYITTHGVPYNFMTGEAYSYFGENATTASVTKAENAGTTVPTIVEAENAEILSATMENTEKTEEKNNENVAIPVLLSVLLLIGMGAGLLMIGIGAGLLISKRKKKQ